MKLKPHEIVDFLSEWSAGTARTAGHQTTHDDIRPTLYFAASVFAEASQLIVQLQDRLVRQACYLETIEANEEPGL